jgi:hypothetical protein
MADIESHPLPQSGHLEPADMTDPTDSRSEEIHSLQDPYFIAEYLARNSSKAAAVFRRFDKLAMYRLIELSKELRRMEHDHDLVLREKRYPLNAPRSSDSQLGPHLVEYCTRSILIEIFRKAWLTKAADDLLTAYSQVLHLEPPAERTVEALDEFIRDPKRHAYHLDWWGYRLKYQLKNGSLHTFPDLVSLFTPAENDYLSKFVDKFLYFFFKVYIPL